MQRYANAFGTAILFSDVFCLFSCFVFLKSPSTPLFCGEAPEMVCGLRKRYHDFPLAWGEFSFVGEL